LLVVGGKGTESSVVTTMDVIDAAKES
jgi:hypothetical protein